MECSIVCQEVALVRLVSKIRYVQCSKKRNAKKHFIGILVMSFTYYKAAIKRRRLTSKA